MCIARSGAVGYPVLVLGCDIAKHIPGDRIDVAVCAEETHDAFGLLKGLDGRIEKHSIEAAIMESDVILMVLKEGVHGNPRDGWLPSEDTPKSAFCCLWRTKHGNGTTQREDLSGLAGMAQSP
jgi:hypothetical protein